jgi:hypothetical protein
MNNFALMVIDASRKKAFTAIGFGMRSGEAWQQFIKDAPILNNVTLYFIKLGSFHSGQKDILLLLLVALYPVLIPEPHHL